MKIKSAKATRIDVAKDGTLKVVYRDRDVLKRGGRKQAQPKAAKRKPKAA